SGAPFALWRSRCAACGTRAGTSSRVPGAAQREVMRCGPGTVTNSEPGTVPHLRCTVRAMALTLHRVRDTSRYLLSCPGRSAARSDALRTRDRYKLRAWNGPASAV